MAAAEGVAAITLDGNDPFPVCLDHEATDGFTEMAGPVVALAAHGLLLGMDRWQNLKCSLFGGARLSRGGVRFPPGAESQDMSKRRLYFLD
jgi:hypothetical protein